MDPANDPLQGLVLLNASAVALGAFEAYMHVTLMVTVSQNHGLTFSRKQGQILFEFLGSLFINTLNVLAQSRDQGAFENDHLSLLIIEEALGDDPLLIEVHFTGPRIQKDAGRGWLLTNHTNVYVAAALMGLVG